MSVKKLFGLLIVGSSAVAVAHIARRKPIVPPTAPTVPTAAPTVAPTAVVPPPTPPTVTPPTPAPPIVSGTLECHAYANSTEVSATVVISGYAKTLVTPFTIDLPAGTYTLTATYSGQTQTVTVKIELGETVRIDFKFALPVTPPPTPVKYVFRFVPPPPPPVLSWAVKGYWEYGLEGQLLAPITVMMAYQRLKYGFYPEIPVDIAEWYKTNYPELWPE